MVQEPADSRSQAARSASVGSDGITMAGSMLVSCTG